MNALNERLVGSPFGCRRSCFTKLEIISSFPQSYSSDEQSLRVVGDGLGRSNFLSRQKAAKRHIMSCVRCSGIRMDDSSEFVSKSGDVSLLPTGHDSWIVGDEPVIVVVFQGMIDFSKSA